MRRSLYIPGVLWTHSLIGNHGADSVNFMQFAEAVGELREIWLIRSNLLGSLSMVRGLEK